MSTADEGAGSGASGPALGAGEGGGSTLAALPAPPYDPVVCKGWRFELDHERIRRSDTWALASPALRPWLLMLWMVAWEQAPTGTLPADDALIAARLGMPAADFAAARDVLLRGWWLASDGRLYHPVMIERVAEMQAARAKAAARQRGHRAGAAKAQAVLGRVAGAARAWVGLGAAGAGGAPAARPAGGGMRVGDAVVLEPPPSAAEPPGAGGLDGSTLEAEACESGDYRDCDVIERINVTRDSRVTHALLPRDSRVSHGTGTGTSSTESIDTPPLCPARGGGGAVDKSECPGAGQALKPAGLAIVQAVSAAGVRDAVAGGARLAALVAAGATVPEFVALAPQAVGKRAPWAWLLAAVEGERMRARTVAEQAVQGPMAGQDAEGAAAGTLVLSADALAAQAVIERALRPAQVHAAVPPSDEQRRRLAEAAQALRRGPVGV